MCRELCLVCRGLSFVCVAPLPIDVMASRARPKSDSRTCPDADTRMFSGLRSRKAMSSACSACVGLTGENGWKQLARGELAGLWLGLCLECGAGGAWRWEAVRAAIKAVVQHTMGRDGLALWARTEGF